MGLPLGRRKSLCDRLEQTKLSTTQKLLLKMWCETPTLCCWKTVKNGGILTAVAAAPAEDQQTHYPTVKYVSFIVKHNLEQLDIVKQLVEEGKLKPVVDRVMRLEEEVEAYTLVMKARTRGKIVLKVG